MTAIRGNVLPTLSGVTRVIVTPDRSVSPIATGHEYRRALGTLQGCALAGSLHRDASGSQTSSATSYSTSKPLPSLRGRTSPVSVHTTSFSQRYRLSSETCVTLPTSSRIPPAPSRAYPCHAKSTASRRPSGERRRSLARGRCRSAAAGSSRRGGGPTGALAVPLRDQEALPLCPSRAGQFHTPRLRRCERRPVKRLKAHRRLSWPRARLRSRADPPTSRSVRATRFRRRPSRTRAGSRRRSRTGTGRHR
jgi:hypothetical protein